RGMTRGLQDRAGGREAGSEERARDRAGSRGEGLGRDAGGGPRQRRIQPGVALTSRRLAALDAAERRQRECPKSALCSSRDRMQQRQPLLPRFVAKLRRLRHELFGREPSPQEWEQRLERIVGETVAESLRWIPENGSFLDVGANVGVYAEGVLRARPKAR